MKRISFPLCHTAFTNGLNLESNVHRGITVGSILKGYDAYDKIVSGDNAGGEIVAVKKKY